MNPFMHNKSPEWTQSTHLHTAILPRCFARNTKQMTIYIEVHIDDDLTLAHDPTYIITTNLLAIANFRIGAHWERASTHLIVSVPSRSAIVCA